MARREVRTYVDDKLLETWRERFGDYASVSWLLETSMKGVLEATEGQPSLNEVVKSSIYGYILKNNPKAREPRDDPKPNA